MAIRQYFSFLCICIAVLASRQITYAQNAETMSVVEDLSLRLYKLDSSQLSFSANLDQEDALGFYITSADRFDLLKICNSDSFSVWREGQMIKDLSLCFELSSGEILDRSSSDTVYFAILSAGYFQDLDISLSANRVEEMKLQNIPDPRQNLLYKEWSILVLLVLGLFAALIRHQNVNLFSYLFGINVRSSRDTEIEVELNLDLVLSLFFVSLICIYNIQLLQLINSEVPAVSTAALMFETFRLTLFLSVVLVLKYFLISFLAGINTLSGVKGIQFVDFIKFFSIGSIVFLFLLQVWFWFGGGFQSQRFWAFENFYLIVYSLFILYFYLKLVQGTSFKKLHIISYLCTTEFIGVFLLALIIYK